MAQVFLNNQSWTQIHSGTFVAKNLAGSRVYLMRAAAQPPAATSVNEALPLERREDLVDFGITGNWWGRCDNENSPLLQTAELRVEPYA